MSWPPDTTALWWIGILGVVSALGSAALLPLLVVWMPADYFVRSDPPPSSLRGRHPAVRVVLQVAKNAVGTVLVVAGAVMLFTPGQGVLTLLLGLSLLDLPGKRRLERRLVASPPVHRAIDAIRRRAHRPPIVLPPRPGAGRR